MSTNQNPIRILSDFTEQYKSYVVSSGKKVLSIYAETGTTVGTEVPEDATYVMTKNNGTVFTRLQFLDDNLATINNSALVPVGHGVAFKIPKGAESVFAVSSVEGESEFIFS